ncbi:SRPBCC domain-containing protein [Georgenia sp. SYP-B2076]|uniref:SRPBCC family protein n=1 Tax=Georgenia sp. SYP-B2076 TaxID=2495881 RepID=UPI000F8DFC98|nr:SRPBCC domain-containing protein [Georgenia sp. SYP-B2076]
MDGRPDGLLELTCTLDAPRERVFRMLTEPAELARWWGPHGFTMPETELDLRAGGRYRFSMLTPGGDVFHVSGEFLEIDPPARLVYTFRWDEPAPDDRETVVTLSLAAAGDATAVSLSHGVFATEERLALHRGGWTDSFERLDALIGRDS